MPLHVMQKLIRLQIAKCSTASQRLIQTASGRCPGGIRTGDECRLLAGNSEIGRSSLPSLC